MAEPDVRLVATSTDVCGSETMSEIGLSVDTAVPSNAPPCTRNFGFAGNVPATLAACTRNFGLPGTSATSAP